MFFVNKGYVSLALLEETGRNEIHTHVVVRLRPFSRVAGLFLSLPCTPLSPSRCRFRGQLRSALVHCTLSRFLQCATDRGFQLKIGTLLSKVTFPPVSARGKFLFAITRLLLLYILRP